MLLAEVIHIVFNLWTSAVWLSSLWQEIPAVCRKRKLHVVSCTVYGKRLSGCVEVHVALSICCPSRISFPRVSFTFDRQLQCDESVAGNVFFHSCQEWLPWYEQSLPATVWIIQGPHYIGKTLASFKLQNEFTNFDSVKWYLVRVKSPDARGPELQCLKISNLRCTVMKTRNWWDGSMSVRGSTENILQTLFQYIVHWHFFPSKLSLVAFFSSKSSTFFPLFPVLWNRTNYFLVSSRTVTSTGTIMGKLMLLYT